MKIRLQCLLLGINFITPSIPHRFTNIILDSIFTCMNEVRMANELEMHILPEPD